MLRLVSHFQGQVAARITLPHQQQQLHELDDGTTIASIELQPGNIFNENTSIWEAMQIMRGYFGEAIAVVDSASGLYLGAIPEAVVINAYLDAAQELRREKYEV